MLLRRTSSKGKRELEVENVFMYVGENNSVLCTVGEKFVKTAQVLNTLGIRKRWLTYSYLKEISRKINSLIEYKNGRHYICRYVSYTIEKSDFECEMCHDMVYNWV